LKKDNLVRVPELKSGLTECLTCSKDNFGLDYLPG
jgi:hypothetical protein